MNIERCGALSNAEFRERFVKPRRPVVLTDAIHAWAARKHWSPSFFRRKHGHRMVTCRETTAPVRLDDYIDSLDASSFEQPAPYLRNLNIQTDWPELVPDIAPKVSYSQPDWLSSRLFPSHWPRPRHLNQLFISGKGARISLHYDDWMTHNLVSNIVGEKQFLLFEPDQGRFLYPRKDEYLVSQIPDPYSVDPDAFPLFAQATPTQVTIGPGESLFVPCGWWHTTRTLSTCISVSSSFANRDNWESLVNEVRYMRTHANAAKWKTSILCWYLKGAGVVLSKQEVVSGAYRQR